MKRLKADFNALGFSAGFIAVSVCFLSRTYDESAFTYVVAAEQGFSKVHQAAHPFYLPLLRFIIAFLRTVGYQGRFLEIFQCMSVLGAGAFLAVLYRLTDHFSKDRWASLAAVLFFACQSHFWAMSMQSKPYTIAAFLAVFSLCVAMESVALPGPAWAPAAAAGLLAGLSIGFEAINIALLPVILAWLLAWRKPRSWSRAGAFLLAACLPLSLTWPAHVQETLAAMYAPGHFAKTAFFRYPHFLELAGLYVSWLSAHLGQTAYGLLVLPFALRKIRQRSEATDKGGAYFLAAAVFLAYSLVFIVFHATDDYAFFAAAGLPLALAALASGRRKARWALSGAAAIVGLQSLLGTIVPRSRPDSDPALAEGRFLQGRLGSGDILAAASAPDWRLAYLYGAKLGMIRLDARPSEGLFAPVGRNPNPEALLYLEAALKQGRRAWLAADQFFRPEGALTREEIDAYQDRLQRLLLKKFAFGKPLVSPQGQWYIPLRLRT